MAGDWRAGDVVMLADADYEGHVLACMSGYVINRWVALTWYDEDGIFFTDEEIDELSPTLVYRPPPVSS